MDKRGARRRSTSLGDGDILSSTIDMPQASSTNRFSNFNPVCPPPKLMLRALLMILIAITGGHN